MLAFPLPALIATDKIGPPRFPGNPSHDFATFLDPGRSGLPHQNGIPGSAPAYINTKAPTLSISRFHSIASSSAVYASRWPLLDTMQHSLPAGWLAFTGRESNPLDYDERFQFILSSFPGLWPGAICNALHKSVVFVTGPRARPQEKNSLLF